MKDAAISSDGGLNRNDQAEDDIEKSHYYSQTS
jgi:hypothetical protein